MEAQSKQVWEAPVLIVIDVAEQTEAGGPGSSDASILS